MKIYLVGGAVRDMVLKQPPHDKDYVVVGADISEMKKLGFQQVGRNFPVFLHPITKDEYALARKEIKIGEKHTDFQFVFDKNVTLQEDVQRRDFTCNALAYDSESDKIIDLVGGLLDIKNKVLRHVNQEHFAEDPLRVLRMCRFAAKLDFAIAPETMILAQNMVHDGELRYLTKERVWQEFYRAMCAPRFAKFVEIMHECGALKAVLPEVDGLWKVPEIPQYHPEGNSGAHTLLVLEQAENLSAQIKFALLLHDVGKTLTPPDVLPHHYGHDEAGVPLVKKICRNLRVPREFQKTALLIVENHMKFHNVPQMRVHKLREFVAVLTQNFRSDACLKDFIAACRCDAWGRKKEISEKEQENMLLAERRCLKVYEILHKLKIDEIPEFDSFKKDESLKDKIADYQDRLLIGI